MQVAAIYDIHGNLPALEAVLNSVHNADVDLVLVGGDVVPGPMPIETLELLREIDIPTRYILGNTDREVLAQMEGKTTDWFRNAPEKWREPVSWAARQMNPQHLKWLREWPATLNVEIPNIGNVLFCHATPQNDTSIFTRLTSEAKLLTIFSGLDVSLVVCGHTHMQFDRMVARTQVVNAGSVGMPFGSTGAFWLLLGPAIKLQKTTYDLVDAAKRIAATDYPDVSEFVDNQILNPPTESAMLKMFGTAELKND